MSNINYARIKVAEYVPELLELFQSLGMSVDKLDTHAVRYDPAKQKIYNKRWQDKNRELVRFYHRRWNKEHPEVIALALKRWREAHPEKAKGRSYAEIKGAIKKYVQTEKGHIAHLQANARWRERNREHLREYSRVYNARKKARQAEKSDSL